MALPTSGAISLADLQTEFGGVNPIGFNEYYAGGGLVPPGSTGVLGALPTNGALPMNIFYGSAGSLLSGAMFRPVTVTYPPPRPVISNGNTAGTADGSLLYTASNNGLTWTRTSTTIPGTTTYERWVEYVGGQYLVNSSNPTGVLLSTDNLYSSTLVVTDVHVGQFLTAAGKYYGLPLYMLTYSGDVYHIYVRTSYDLQTWTNFISIPGFATTGLAYVATSSSGGLFVSLPGKYVYNTSVFYYNGQYSNDGGANWIQALCYDSSGNVFMSDSVWGNLEAIFQRNNTLFRITLEGKLLTFNSDRFNLSASVVLPNFGSFFTTKQYPTILDVFYKKKIFVATCDEYAIALYKTPSGSTQIATSTDGTTWTAQPSITIAGVTPIALFKLGTNWVVQTLTGAYVCPI